MVSWIVGALGLVVLLGVVRRRRHRRHHSFRRAWARRQAWALRRGDGMNARRRPALHLLFARLETTPGQEKAIKAALDTLRGRMEGTSTEIEALSRDLAVLVSGSVLDQTALDAVKARTDALFGRFTTELRDLFALVHDALDDAQRRTFAELIRDGSLFLEVCEHESARRAGPFAGFDMGLYAHRHGPAC